MEKDTTTIEVVLFAETILGYFEEVKMGVCSDYAWYSLLCEAEIYLEEPYKEFEEILKIEFNIHKDDFAKIKRQYKKQLKEVLNILGYEKE